MLQDQKNLLADSDHILIGMNNPGLSVLPPPPPPPIINIWDPQGELVSTTGFSSPQAAGGVALSLSSGVVVTAALKNMVVISETSAAEASVTADVAALDGELATAVTAEAAEDTIPIVGWIAGGFTLIGIGTLAVLLYKAHKNKNQLSQEKQAAIKDLLGNLTKLEDVFDKEIASGTTLTDQISDEFTKARETILTTLNNHLSSVGIDLKPTLVAAEQKAQQLIAAEQQLNAEIESHYKALEQLGTLVDKLASAEKIDHGLAALNEILSRKFHQLQEFSNKEKKQTDFLEEIVAELENSGNKVYLANKISHSENNKSVIASKIALLANQKQIPTPQIASTAPTAIRLLPESENKSVHAMSKAVADQSDTAALRGVMPNIDEAYLIDAGTNQATNNSDIVRGVIPSAR